MSKSSSSRPQINIETQILDSNPILESFGNAKTLRNNNSSRFGKYMEINFDDKNNIKGCNITSYLLEKTRVVKVSTLERNYHIFYMFIAGLSKEDRSLYSLKNINQFQYLIAGGCIEIDHRNDAEEFAILIKAMNNLNFDELFQNMLWSLIACILHLGNLEFIKKNDDGSSINNMNDSKRIAVLLGLSDANIEILEQSLCFRENIVNKEVYLIPLTPIKAAEQRDSLAKYIYR